MRISKQFIKQYKKLSKKENRFLYIRDNILHGTNQYYMFVDKYKKHNIKDILLYEGLFDTINLKNIKEYIELKIMYDKIIIKYGKNMNKEKIINNIKSEQKYNPPTLKHLLLNNIKKLI